MLKWETNPLLVQMRLMVNKNARSVVLILSCTKKALKFEVLKVIYHPLHSMNNFVTNKSKLPQYGHKSILILDDWLYHVTLWEGRMIVNHPT